MRLAILFWGYKDIELCANRLRLLRRLNPDAPIYVLYGGAQSGIAEFQKRLAPLADDFYAYDKPIDAEWKWRHGDQMIVDWYRERGRRLPFDTIFVAQWDLVVLAPIARLCRHLRPDELLLSGLRRMDEIVDWWYWTQLSAPGRPEYFQFLQHVRDEFGFAEAPLCCQFIIACLPRKFLDRYAEVPQPLLGFIEYKIPVYAQVFGFRFCTRHRFDVLWEFDPHRPATDAFTKTLVAQDTPIPAWLMQLHALLPGGRRAFHPVHVCYPDSPVRRLRQAARSLLDDVRHYRQSGSFR